MNTSDSIWPDKHPFGLFLSHDIDQIHDRELFRVLADLNHVRRIWTQGEKGSAALALRRVARALIAPNFRQWMPHAIHPLIESGILLASIAAVILNVFFNGASHDTSAAVHAARQADAH